MTSDRRQALGTCYYPEHWPEERWPMDAALMVEAGLSYVRIGEFAWSRLEPSRGQYAFDWLDRAMNVLGAAGLKVVLGTPTATPPKWLVDEMSDMIAVDFDGHPRGFGSRRHYCFSHQGYRGECKRIVTELAKRFGNHRALAAWQTDNEYGCHDTIISYSMAARDGFRDWLSQKYQSPDVLNRAWGNVFWSMEYNSFDAVELPHRTVTEPNPAHSLDFKRYSSAQVVSFNRLQTDIIRTHSPHPVSHNFMGSFTDFDHYAVSDDLDIATWDSYPIGFLDRDANTQEVKQRYLGVGDPDLQAFHHDLYRACGQRRNGQDQGRWWVMEQQPGPVNWAPYNPAPAPGAVSLWAWEAFAHGAELVAYFRWRQPSFGQEQMHEAMLLPNAEKNEAFHAAAAIRKTLDQIGATASNDRADVALVFDYESAWAWNVQPQGADFSALDTVLRWYRSLRRLGLSVDVVAPTPDAVKDRKMVVIGGLFYADDALVDALAAEDAIVVLGPRAGSKTSDFQIHPDLPPGALQRLIDVQVTRVETRPPSSPLTVEGQMGQIEGWREFVRTADTVKTRSSSQDGHGVWFSDGRVHYVAGRPDAALAQTIMAQCAQQAGLTTSLLHRDLRIRDNGAMRYIFNYGPEAVDVSALVGDTTLVLGNALLPGCGVAACRRD